MCNRIGCQRNDCICDSKIGDQVLSLGNGLVYEVVGLSLVSKTPIVMRIGVNPFIITNPNWRKYTPPRIYTGYMNVYCSDISKKFMAGDIFSSLDEARAMPDYRQNNWKGLIRIHFEEGFEAKE